MLRNTSLLLGLFLCLRFTSNSQDPRCNFNVDFEWMQSNAPQRYLRFINLENFSTSYINGQIQNSSRLVNGNNLIIIPVVVHVLHHGEAEGVGYNVSMAAIQSQIDVLNEDFRRLNSDAINTPSAFLSVASDFGIEFRLACIDPNNNPTNGVVRKYTSVEMFDANVPLRPDDGTTDEETIGIKTAQNGSVAWPSDRYLNIWVCSMNLGGYASSPADYSTYPQYDGIVIKKEAFGRVGGTAGIYNKGRTGTHEIGHWLNLFHLWGDTGWPNFNVTCSEDDFVGDTPKQQYNHQGCPSFPFTTYRCNTSDVSTMFMNYMDYSNDDCLNMFTNGQKMRARALFATGG